MTKASSKMFEIDTYIAPPETTAEQNNQSGNSDSDDRDTTKTTKKSNSTKSTTKKESTTKKKSKSSSSKSSTKSKSKTNKSSSSKTNRSSKSQGIDEEYLADDVDEIETYTLPSGENTRNAARVKRKIGHRSRHNGYNCDGDINLLLIFKNPARNRLTKSKR